MTVQKKQLVDAHGNVPGDIWNFQCWYRDVANTNNFTNAVSVTFN